MPYKTLSTCTIYTKLTLLALCLLLGATSSTKLQANNVQPSSPLKKLWSDSKNDSKARLLLADYYLSKGAFKQARQLLVESWPHNGFDYELFEKIIRCIKGMRAERSEIRRIVQLKTPSFIEQITLFQLYILINNKTAAANCIFKLAEQNSSHEFLRFLANGAGSCLKEEDSLPFFLRLAQSELQKNAPSSYPFLKAAEIYSTQKNPLKAIETLNLYIESNSPFQLFLYPNQNAIFTKGFRAVCQAKSELQKTVQSTTAAPMETVNTDLTIATPDNSMPEAKEAMVAALGSKQEELHSRKEKEILSLLASLRPMTSLQHLTIALIMKKTGFEKAFSTQMQKALSVKLNPQEIDHLQATVYPDEPRARIVELHQSFVYTTLSKYYTNTGKPDLAVSCCKEALIENPLNEDALGLMKALSKEPLLSGLSRNALREIAKIHNNVKILSLAAVKEIDSATNTGIYDAAHKAFGLAPHNHSALKAYVKACLHKGLGTRAVDACLTAIGHGAPEDVFLTLADASTRTGLATEARNAVREIILCNSSPGAKALTGYSQLCNTKESRTELVNICTTIMKESTDKSTRVAAGITCASSLLQNRQILQAKEMLKSILTEITPKDEMFDSAKQLSHRLKLDAEFSRSLAEQATYHPLEDQILYYREAARIAHRGNLSKDSLSYYGKALEAAAGNPHLEDEFLDFGRWISGFPFFMQGLLERTTGHHEFYRLLGRYYLQRGHSANAVSFLSKAHAWDPDRKDIELLYGRALCADKKHNKGFKIARNALKAIDEIPDRLLWGILREAIKKSEKSIIETVIRHWLMTPSELNHQKARAISALALPMDRYDKLITELKENALHAPWILLEKARLSQRGHITDEDDRLITNLESSILEARKAGAEFKKGSLPDDMCKTYFDIVVRKNECERAFAFLGKLLSGKPDDLQIRRYYEKICILISKEGHLLRSLEQSINYFPALSPQRLDRLEELSEELSREGMLNVIIDELPALSSLSPDEAASQVYLRWYSSLVEDDHPAKVTQLERNLVERLSLHGRKALPALLRMGRKKEALLLIDRLLLRHGESRQLELLSQKGKLLSEHDLDPVSAAETFETIVTKAPQSPEADKARLAIIHLINTGSVEAGMYHHIVSQVLSKTDQTVFELASIGRYYLQTLQWPMITRTLQKIYSRPEHSLSSEELDAVTTLLDEIIFSPNMKDEYTILKKAIALVARKLKTPLINHRERARLDSICEKAETDYLKRLLRFSKSGTARKKGLLLTLHGCYNIIADDDFLQSRTHEESLEKLIRLKPAVKDIYGNTLAQMGQLNLMRKQISQGQFKKAFETGQKIRKSGHRIGPDSPGSPWMEADWLQIGLNNMKNAGEQSVTKGV